MREPILIVIICLCTIQLMAQDTMQLVRIDTAIYIPEDTNAQHKLKWWEILTKKPRPPKKGRFYGFPIPLFSASPTVNFLYGIGATGSWYLGEPADTRISNAQIGIAYTVKNQTICTFKSALYAPHDDWIFYGDWRFIISSQPDFALGSGPQTDILATNGIKFNDDPYAIQAPQVKLLYYYYLRIYESALRRVVNKLYMGIAYHLDYYFKVNDALYNSNNQEPVITNFYTYNIKNGFGQTGSLLSGVSANAVYDTRDNQNNPYSGRYAYISFRYNPTFLGSTKNSSTIWMEYRDYINIKHNHRNILAFWAYGDFVTSGALPFLNLPAIGADQFARSGEAYILGRFRGESVVYGETEYRRHLFAIKNYPDFFGMVLFANVTTAGAKEDNIPVFKYWDPAFGGGIRINISRVPRSNVGIVIGK